MCPDGKLRHLPYHNERDAKSDAVFIDEAGCHDPNTGAKSDCPGGGPHKVEPIVFEHS